MSGNVSVEQFTRDLVSLGGVYSVDDAGYIINKGDPDDPVLLKIGTGYKRLMVIKETITDNDAVIINPLNENIAESNDSKWLYMMLNVGMAKRFIDIMRFLKIAIETEKDETSDIHLTSEVIAFASKHKDFDAKTLEQLEHIAKKKHNFMSVWYNRKMKEARFRCSVYDPDTVAEFPNVTKKAWKIIASLISDILDVSPDVEKAADQIKDKYSYTSDLITVPKLESMLNVYSKIYGRLNRYLTMCEMDDEDFVVDLTTLGHHIENIDKYYQKAKWFTTASTTVAEKPVIRTVEGSIPVSQSSIPSNSSFVQPMNIGYTEPESSIPSNPARHGLEYASYQQEAIPQRGFVQQPQMGFGGRPGCVPINPNPQPMFGAINQQPFGGGQSVRIYG